jgi:hypothetical protein
LLNRSQSVAEPVCKCRFLSCLTIEVSSAALTKVMGLGFTDPTPFCVEELFERCLKGLRK